MAEFLVCCYLLALLLLMVFGKWVFLLVMLFMLNNLADRLRLAVQERR